MPWPARIYAWTETAVRDRVGVNAVFRCCRRHGLPPKRAAQIAEEAVPDAHVKAREQEEKTPEYFKDFDHYCRWITKTARNNAIDMLRKEHARQFEDGEAERLRTALSEWPEVMQEQLLQLIAGMTPEERRLLDLKYYEGRTLDEITAAVTPPDDRTPAGRRSEVNRQLARSREQLRNRLDQADDTQMPT